jgi:cytoskeletal protein RodZ
MNCSQCGNPVPADAAFCPACGADVQTVTDATIVVPMQQTTRSAQNAPTMVVDMNTLPDTAVDPTRTVVAVPAPRVEERAPVVAPPPPPKRKSALPKILLILAVLFILGAAVLGIGGYLIYRRVAAGVVAAQKAVTTTASPTITTSTQPPPPPADTATVPTATVAETDTTLTATDSAPAPSETVNVVETPATATTKSATPAAPQPSSPKAKPTRVAATPKPQPVAESAEASAPEEESSEAQTAPARGGLRARLFGRRGAQAAASTELGGPSFHRGVISDYGDMKKNRYVSYAAVSPSATLAKSKATVSLRAMGNADSSTVSRFRAAIQNAIDDVTEDANGRTLRGDGAIYWTATEKWVELVFRDGSGHTVAKLRQNLRERSVDDAAEEAADAIGDFYEEN